ncbi:hypothetical protein RP726_02670 [Candidatus Methylospira mobilis]|uniref:hypothetical protein n=1 Tax=Candidatus Methylospira mobilis TaxID=1808979 RepID=UPI0028E84C81|nr:hypothetical protein [Candidatus Methylospira mobilis]WNV05325.1 hypothetical protein RP726_02670 [Candidatus Methylospira mobilis]
MDRQRREGAALARKLYARDADIRVGPDKGSTVLVGEHGTFLHSAFFCRIRVKRIDKFIDGDAALFKQPA